MNEKLIKFFKDNKEKRTKLILILRIKNSLSEIAKLLDMKEELIESVTSTEFKTVANRPLDTSFDNTLMKKNGIHPRTLKQTILNLL